MARPKKDPLAPKAPKVFASFKLPVGVGRVVVIRVPSGGLTETEAEFVRKFLPMLVIDRQGELGEDDEDGAGAW